MSEQQYRLLSLLGRLPARLTVEQTAWVLNCQPHDMSILVSAKLIKPLGNPAPNGVKYFAATDILERIADRAWLAKITNTVCEHWKKKNSKKIRKQGGSSNSANAHSTLNSKSDEGSISP